MVLLSYLFQFFRMCFTDLACDAAGHADLPIARHNNRAGVARALSCVAVMN